MAAESYEEYTELLCDAGLTAQERAPFTPIVKLVFGAGYDKTRLTEFASALKFAQRNAVPMGGLANLLAKHDGGLKAIVSAERRAKKLAAGIALSPASTDPRPRYAPHAKGICVNFLALATNLSCSLAAAKQMGAWLLSA